MAGNDQSNWDEATVARAVAGDKHALGMLLLRHHDRLLRAIERNLPTRLTRTVSAEDVLQDVHVEAYRAIGTFHYSGSDAFYRWLSTIARNRLLDLVRRATAAKRGGLAETLEPAGDAAASDLRPIVELLAGRGTSPSQAASREEACQAVRQALAELPADARQALCLRYLERRPVAEIGALMNRSQRAVHGLCYRGLQTLEQRLGRASRFL